MPLGCMHYISFYKYGYLPADFRVFPFGKMRPKRN